MDHSGTNITCDVAVIGGGPAGMMAAGTAARFGADVVLLEKNGRPGKKLLLTGKGRCNITSADDDPRSFLGRFGSQGRYLHSVLHSFGVEDTIEFFTARGLPLKVERGGRVFPESDLASDVLETLEGYMAEHGVRVVTRFNIRSVTKKDDMIDAVSGERGSVSARRYILCTGGMSYPGTGSTGDGYGFASSLGHTVVTPRPSLVPVVLSERWPGEAEGLSLKNVTVRLIRDGKVVAEEFGEALFTSRGMSGPVILDLSRTIGSLPPEGLELSIDLKPALDMKALDARILRDFSGGTSRLFKNGLGRLLPASLIPIIVRLSGVAPDSKVAHITRDERKRLCSLLKDLRAHVSGLEGFERAVITAGGVSLDEVDMRSMRSRLIENLYFAGEILDIDGPTGGFNLQICWSTGYCAGTSAGGMPPG